jgi:hypothetical protein
VDYLRKIIVSEFISLDGVIEEPQWMHKYIQSFAVAWPKITDRAPNNVSLPDSFPTE